MQLKQQKQWLGQKRYPAFLIITVLLMVFLAACGDNTPTPAGTPTTPATTPTAATSPTPVTSPTLAATTAAGTGTATGSNTSAVTVNTPASTDTPPPGAMRGTDGRFYYIVDPILPFYQANSWLGLPLGGMREARPDGYNWEGVYQNFQRGRVEAHRNGEGKYSLELGLVNQELVTLKGQSR